MALKMTDNGAMHILQTMFDDKAKESGFEVILFTNPTSLSDADIESTFTEASGGGYVQKSITSADCAVSLTAATPGGIAEAAWSDLAWTFTGGLSGGLSIKGYALVAASSPFTVIFAELLSTPFTPTNNGDKLTIAMKFRLGNGTPL